jgi:prepilin-type N-terminal cleavage/methylation domain-containing protein
MRKGGVPDLAGSQAGFTLVELLVACAIIGIGLVAAFAGFTTGIEGLEIGRLQSTAAFLAEQRIEQIKAMATVNWTNVTPTTFPNEAYGSIPNAPRYRRTVTITDNPGGLTGTKRVDVAVFFRPVAGANTVERQVSLSVLLARH